MRWLRNGTLVFGSLEEFHAGSYLCDASNGVGLDISATVSVVVHRQPRFASKVARQRGRVGETAELSCEAEGDDPISFSWLKDEVPVSSIDGLRVEITETATEKGSKSELKLHSLRDFHAGEYKCSAKNAFGVDQRVIRLSVIAVPEVPRNLRPTVISSRLVGLTWDASRNISSSASNYVVIFRKSTETWDDSRRDVEVHGHRNNVDVGDLLPGTEYRFKIAAENEVGRSKFSLEITAVTDEEPPDAAPANISAFAASSSEIAVSWSAPPPRARNGKLTGYKVGVRPTNGGINPNPRLSVLGDTQGFNFTDVPISRADFDQSARFQGLKPFSVYEVVVVAANARGPGPFSPPVLVTTREAKPTGSAKGVRCEASSSTSIRISWEPPARDEAHGIIRGYRVLCELVPDFEGRIISSWFDTAAREIDIPDLMKFSNYSFRVLAFNKEGDGPLGAPHFCMTAEDVPDAPEGIKALQISPKTVLVSWKPPLRPNGVVERYDLEIKEHSANAFPSLSSASDTLASAFPLSRGRTETKKVKTLPGRKTVSTFQDAVPGWVYEFSVSASTSAGQGQQTAPFILTLEQNVPARIASWGTNLETTVGSSLLLECLRFGLPNPNLTWGDEYNTLINFNDRVVAKDDGSLVISDVTRGDSGKYTCNVANSHGNDAITYSITVRSSPKPPKLQATKASTSNISLQFVVMDDGGSPVRGFLLRLHRVRGNVNDVAIPSDQDVAAQSAVIGSDFDNEIMPTNSFDELIVDGFPKHRPESLIIEVSREVNSYTVEGLACGSSYSVAISAWNSAGHGKFSEQIIVRTEGTKPQVPDSRTVLDVNSTYAIFHVDRWTGASCPVLYFVAKYKEEAWKTWAPISRAGKDVRSPIILDDLRPATAYELSIRAVSEAGETVFQHRFFTLNILGVAVAGEASVKGDSDGPSFSDVRIMTPTILSIVAVAVTVASVYVFLRRRRIPEERVEMAQMKGNTYQEYMLKYYTLLGKQAAERASVADDKSECSAPPEYHDDIHPYATFHLDKKLETTKCLNNPSSPSGVGLPLTRPGNLLSGFPPTTEAPMIPAGGAAASSSVIGRASASGCFAQQSGSEYYGYGCPVPSTASVASVGRRFAPAVPTPGARMAMTFDKPSPCTLDRRRFRHKRKSESARKFKSLRGGLSDGEEDDDDSPTESDHVMSTPMEIRSASFASPRNIVVYGDVVTRDAVTDGLKHNLQRPHMLRQLRNPDSRLRSTHRPHVTIDSPSHRLHLYNLGLEPGLPIPVRPCPQQPSTSAAGDYERVPW